MMSHKSGHFLNSNPLCLHSYPELYAVRLKIFKHLHPPHMTFHKTIESYNLPYWPHMFSRFSLRSCGSLRLSSQMSKLRQVTRQILVYLSTQHFGMKTLHSVKAFQDIIQLKFTHPKVNLKYIIMFFKTSLFLLFHKAISW